jgi:HSP20 family protein
MARNGFSPLRDFMTLREGMDRLFEDRWVSPGSWLTWSPGTNYLPVDIFETADDMVVRAIVPGVAPEGIDIQFQAGVLTLRATSEEAPIPEGANWLVHEVTPGEYIRQITLPRSIDADKAETTFERSSHTHLAEDRGRQAQADQGRVGATDRRRLEWILIPGLSRASAAASTRSPSRLA